MKGSVCPDIYITWLGHTVPGSRVPLLRWSQGAREDQYDTNYRLQAAPASPAPGQGFAALPHWPASPLGPLAIKLVFYCQPRHNLPLIINLPPRPRRLALTQPVLECDPVLTWASPDPRVQGVRYESLPCVENFKIRPQGGWWQRREELGWLSQLGRTEPLAVSAGRGRAGLEAGLGAAVYREPQPAARSL